MSQEQLEKLEQFNKRFKSQIFTRTLNLRNSKKAFSNLKQTKPDLQINSERNDTKPTKLFSSDEIFELATREPHRNRTLLNASPLLETRRLINENTLTNLKTNSRLIFDQLNLQCPVSLHQKMAFSNFGIDCKCKKYLVPLVYDVEYDYFLKMLPPDQVIVVVIIDSK